MNVTVIKSNIYWKGGIFRENQNLQYINIIIKKTHCKYLTCLMMLNFSCRYIAARIEETKTLNAPKGVTNEAGAKAYAAKLATSPIPTKSK